MKSNFKNEKGSALLSVIIVATILVTLGVAVLSMNLAETKYSVASEKHLQAEYIAKSGADIAAKYMKDHPDEVTASITGSPIGNGTFNAYVTATDNPNVKKIVSTGTVTDTGYTSEVTLIIKKNKEYSGIFTGITTTSNLPLELYDKINLYLKLIIVDSPSMDITANVASEADIILHSDYENDDRFHQIAKTVDLPPVIIPDYSTYTTIRTNPITQNYYESGTLTDAVSFDTTAGDIIVVTNKIDFKSNKGVSITGCGSVHINFKSTQATSMKSGNENVNSN